MTPDETPDTPLTQEQLRQYRDAFEQEFTAGQENAPTRTAIKDIEELKETSLTTLKGIMSSSQDDSLRAKIAMWSYDRLLDQRKANADPLMDFVQGMQDKTPSA